jgi:secondary thiamine-phosphate synthase enzyme
LTTAHTQITVATKGKGLYPFTLDLKDFFEQLVPENAENFRHTLEGPDDMTSHIRSALTHTSMAIPVIGGRMALGTWQGLYLFEHRRIPHERSIILQLIGVQTQK